MQFRRAMIFVVTLSISCGLIGHHAFATPPVEVPGGSICTTMPSVVRDMKFDSAARPIFGTTGDVDPRPSVEDVYAKKTNAVSGSKILLIDHQHRIWIRPDADKDQTTVQMYDGRAWITRQVSDIPADANRQLAGIHFVGGGVEDAMGNVWFVDGDHSQGWWLHQFTPDGKWAVTVLHERALLGAKGPKKAEQRVLDFVEPKLQVGPDGLFYASWFSNRVDGGPGQGASGFQQFNSSGWTTYFYPTGSNKIDNVQSVIPLPDGSVGFVRLIDEPRVVWMTSALSRPVPDLDPYLERLSGLSSRDRESAQADLIAMGPRVRKPLEEFAAQSDDPEIKSRVPVILQEISKPPQRGVYGGRFTFNSWRFLHQAASGRVYLAVQGCKDLSGKANFKEAMIAISPEGVWTSAESPAKRYGQPASALAVFEDSLGRRWYRITKVGVLLDDGKAKPRKIADETFADATIRGADTSGRLYLLGKDGVIVLDPSAPPPATTTSTTPTTLPQ